MKGSFPGKPRANEFRVDIEFQPVAVFLQVKSSPPPSKLADGRFKRPFESGALAVAAQASANEDPLFGRPLWLRALRLLHRAN